jgi:hypothetical protein
MHYFVPACITLCLHALLCDRGGQVHRDDLAAAAPAEFPRCSASVPAAAWLK